MKTFKQLMEMLNDPARIRVLGVQALGAKNVQDFVGSEFANKRKAGLFQKHYDNQVQAGATHRDAYAAAVQHANATHAADLSRINNAADTRERRLTAIGQMASDPNTPELKRRKAERIFTRGNVTSTATERGQARSRRDNRFYATPVQNPFIQNSHQHQSNVIQNSHQHQSNK